MRGTDPALRGGWVGPDGQPLPFTDDTAIIDLLENARVVERKTIPQGINKPDRLLLERDVVGFKPRNVAAWIRQVWDKDLFDNLILNVDRNSGNMLVGEYEHLWLIGHTRAFQPTSELLDPGALRRVNKEAWARLLAMTEDDLRHLLGSCLDGAQVGALVRRRELLVEHVEALVDERGEAAVFY